MPETAIEPSTLPLQSAAPDASVRRFTETIATTLAPEVVWAEFTRALTNSQEAVLWPNEVSTVRALQPPLATGAVLAERIQYNGAVVHYRLLRFEPSRLLVEYGSLQGHPLSGGAVVSVEGSEGAATLRWQGEYRGSEAQLGLLDRFRAAFFGKLALQFKQLESAQRR
ncbi:SRPBCC family protein [Hyalangium gracile]|uniref:SRPBCC family protein n=1 Tax=Hyalangium gracile TaxID=394092 RepID=UPI001CC91E18|nr:SRPBCC family protein [Hyalangium gracile]